jgi:hypothetical protein
MLDHTVDDPIAQAPHLVRVESQGIGRRAVILWTGHWLRQYRGGPSLATEI